MRIFERAVLRWDEARERYVLDAEESRWTEYAGPVALAKGASVEQKNLEAQQAQMYQTQTAMLQERFAKQDAILASLQKAWGPTLALGPDQRGFSDEERAALKSQAIQGTGQEYQKAVKAVGEGMAARGGGDVFIPSGADEALRAQIATAAAESQAGKNLALTEEDYALGRAKFSAATSALSGVSQMFDPLGFANSANQAGSAASESAYRIAQLNNQFSFANAVTGILTGAAQGAAQGFAGKCWIAEAIWGAQDARTHLVRAYLNAEFGERWYGRGLMALYERFGRQVARQVRAHRWLGGLLRPLFELALWRAERWAGKTRRLVWSTA
jgi:hypothetical protein